MSCVSAEDLAKVLIANPLVSGSNDAKTSPPDRKLAVENWTNLPLNSIADIHAWYDQYHSPIASMKTSANLTSTTNKHQDSVENARFSPGVASGDESETTAYVQNARDEQQPPAFDTKLDTNIERGSVENSEDMEYLEHNDVNCMMYRLPSQGQLQQDIDQQSQQHGILQQNAVNESVIDILENQALDTSTSVGQNTESAESAPPKGLGLTKKFQEDFIW